MYLYIYIDCIRARAHRPVHTNFRVRVGPCRRLQIDTFCNRTRLSRHCRNRNNSFGCSCYTNVTYSYNPVFVHRDICIHTHTRHDLIC